MHDMDFGYITFEPTAGITDSNSFSADDYILWPQAVLTQNGTMVNGVLNTALPYDATDIKTDDTNATNNVYKSYELKKLEELIAGAAGWQDGQGGVLDKTDLSKKFTMQEAIQFGVSLKLPSGTNIQINDGSVLAPVGPGGAYANIPTGSIAFRINKDGASKIRVIVSVPVSKVFGGEGALNEEFDYYLGLWKTEDLADDGSWQLSAFNQTSAVQKFELPRSHPYEPGTTAANSDYILVNHDGTTYRCYLNGERILVGYEFTVTEAGTYILGTAIGETTYGEGIFDSILGMLGATVTESAVQYPMEIVYASADGTASPGNDGTSTSVYGSIDYVYSYDNKIIHVQDYETTSSTINYNRYYNSNRITFTQNELTNSSGAFVDIQNFQAYVWRTVETTDDKGTADTEDDVQKIFLNISVKSASQAEAAYFYYRSAGYDPDEIRITVGIRS
jgi:hypothetical protein